MKLKIQSTGRFIKTQFCKCQLIIIVQKAHLDREREIIFTAILSLLCSLNVYCLFNFIAVLAITILIL